MSNSLASAIQKKLDAQNMTVSALERKAGLKQSVVRNILYGRSLNPHSDTLSAIASAFNCTVDELIQAPKASTQNTQSSHATSTPQPKINLELALDCLQVIGNIIVDSKKEPSAEQFWSLITETYYYSAHAEGKVADKKYAEWIVSMKLQ